MELDELSNKNWHFDALQYQPRFCQYEASVILGRPFFSYNGPRQGHLYHIDKFLVLFEYICLFLSFYLSQFN